MSLLESIILGIIQGLTEFLPVSSSGHIELGKAVLGVHPADPLAFSIVVHGATALSTVVVYWKDIWHILREIFKFQWNDATRFVVFIIISMIPVGVIGLTFEDQIESLFEENVLLVGAMLLITAVLLFFSSRARAASGDLTGWKALVVGIAQAIAILPGISRSGATISTALILGIDREMAARFSFLMVLPPILGAMLLQGKDLLEGGGTAASGDISVPVLIAGFLAAFLAGLLACQWMIRLVKRSKLDYFAIYCAVVGLIALFWGLFNQ